MTAAMTEAEAGAKDELHEGSFEPLGPRPPGPALHTSFRSLTEVTHTAQMDAVVPWQADRPCHRHHERPSLGKSSSASRTMSLSAESAMSA